MSNELLLERIKLKNQTKKWRIIAIIAIIIVLISRVPISDNALPGQDYIAEIAINGFIATDKHRNKMLTKLADNDHVKGVIINVDSPGGAAAGGEELYNLIKRISDKKPVVIIMRNMATSAAYMLSLAGDHIFAQRGSLTGSIGVIFQTPDVSVLAEKIGVNVNQLTTGDLKGEPNMFEPMKQKTRDVMMEVINDFQDVFVGMIAKERKMELATVRELADGRVYSGQQAVNKGLVDAIGSDLEAKAWLETNEGLKDLKVIEVKARTPQDKWKEMLEGNFSATSILPKQFTSYGLLSYYQHVSM